MQTQDLIGMIFGRLTVIERAEDYVTKSGKHQAMWKCQCDCGNIKVVRSATLKNGTSTSCGCLHKKVVKKQSEKTHRTPIKMTLKEKEEFDELYQYVRRRVMGYDENQSLSRTMTLRLKGLKVNKYIENRNIKDTANYSYSVILATFKYCILDIEKSFRTKNFDNEMAKFNYAMAIVESNLNTVYNRLRTSAKAKETTQAVDVASVGYEGAAYQKKTEKTSSRLNNLW